MHNHSAKVDIKSFEKTALGSLEELKKSSLSFHEMRSKKESSNTKREKSSYRHYSPERKRTFHIPFKWILLLIILGGLFYDHQYNESKKINKIAQIFEELLKELDKNTQKDRDKIADSLEIKDTDRVKKSMLPIDSSTYQTLHITFKIFIFRWILKRIDLYSL